MRSRSLCRKKQRRSALGRPLDIIIPESLRERHWQGFRATMCTGKSRYGDGEVLSVPAVRKDGLRISVEFTIVPFTNDSGHMVHSSLFYSYEPVTDGRQFRRLHRAASNGPCVLKPRPLL
jgi:hypothetical protein